MAVAFSLTLLISAADDLYEILSNLPESVEYSCSPCSRTKPSSWREVLQEELRAGLEKVLSSLLTSPLTQHLAQCSEVRRATARPEPQRHGLIQPHACAQTYASARTHKYTNHSLHRSASTKYQSK